MHIKKNPQALAAKNFPSIYDTNNPQAPDEIEEIETWFYIGPIPDGIPGVWYKMSLNGLHEPTVTEFLNGPAECEPDYSCGGTATSDDDVMNHWLWDMGWTVEKTWVHEDKPDIMSAVRDISRGS